MPDYRHSIVRLTGAPITTSLPGVSPASAHNDIAISSKHTRRDMGSDVVWTSATGYCVPQCIVLVSSK